ncbi:MAG: sigma-70 family RNA polymerase sigma factor [Bacteroidetes bacterium]|nr:sigma-70 family RNA polymerase sigma factor [Bacteroidota bacterium]MCB0846007.1 sigma-70 family RNA polymerase sigma factor [Bacteroidota bacterium]MCB0853612.1 sigma-70 family RNA polymerase sigma factor [Bacteroidota bacterium]
MSPLNKLTDQEIIQVIRAGGPEGEKCIDYLYNKAYIRMIHKIKRKLFLDDEDIKDAYTDAVVKLVEQIKKGKFRGDSKLSSYFYRIFYNKSVDVARKNSSNQIEHLPIEEVVPTADPAKNILDLLEVSDDRRKVQMYLDKLSEKCKIILLYFAKGYNMEEIAEMAELKNAESATSQKYKCFKKLEQLIKGGWQ